MGSEICHVNITSNGVSSSCNNHKQKSRAPRIIKVNTEPFRVRSIPDLSESAAEVKKNIVDKMLTSVSDCYHGKKDGYVCSDPIELHVQEHEKCNACKIHIPTLEERVMLAKTYGIPISMKIHSVGTKRGAKIYSEAGCHGTPCVVLKNKDGTYTHISEGIDQDIGFFSALFGIKNPLVYGMDNEMIPTRFAKRINNL